MLQTMRGKSAAGSPCRLHRVTENAATYENKVELLFHCLPKKLPLEFIM